MPQATLHPVAVRGSADRLAHDETDPGRPSTRPEDDVGDQGRSGGTSTGTHGGTELVTVGHPLLTRKHRGLRPRASRGPCGDGRPGWRGRRGCACGDGSRASWHDGDYSADTYACSRSDSFEDRAGSTATGNPRCGSADRVIRPARGHAAGVVHRTDTPRYGRLGTGSNRPTLPEEVFHVQTTRRSIQDRMSKRVVTRRGTLLASRRYARFPQTHELTDPSFTSCGKLCGPPHRVRGPATEGNTT